MKKPLNNIIINQALEEICTNEIFAKSPRNVRLLRFLVQQALEENFVKEQVIGLELFEKSYEPEKNDSKVRVYMYNLRKKLEEYYNEAGNSATIIFTIEKGQYNVSFIEPKEAAKSLDLIKNTERHNKITQYKKIGLLAGIIIVLLVGYYISQPQTIGYCWEPFFQTGSQNLVIVSDHFTVLEQQESRRWHSTVIPDINSEKDLLEYQQKNKKNKAKLKNSEYTLLTKMAPHAVHELTKWFLNYNSDFDLRIESEFRYEDTREHNILFIGQFKTMHTSKGFFLKDSKKFEVLRDGFLFHDENEDIKYKTKFKEDLRVEYAMVSFVPLDNGKKALFFTSNHDIGVMSTVRNFTNKKWLKEFYAQLPEGTTYYNALFEVTGMLRTEMTCDLKAIEYTKTAPEK